MLRQHDNLLEIADQDPPMGDLSARRMLSDCRALWTSPLPEEKGAPRQRIIHARVFKPHGLAEVRRIGIRIALGLHKCGSKQEPDWITSLRVLSQPRPGAPFSCLLHLADLAELPPEEVRWLELPPFTTSGLSLEIRRCGVDDWWPSWNLAAGAFILEGKLLDPPAPRREEKLELEKVRLHKLPDGLTARIHDGQVRFRSPHLEVGFFLSRPGFAHLGIDQDGTGRTGLNLLKVTAAIFQQGAFLEPLGSSPIADRAVRFRFKGTTSVQGNQVRYRLEAAEVGQSYDLQWTVHPDGLTLEAERQGKESLMAWESSAWTWTLQPSVSVPHAMGEVIRSGQTGLLESPALLHFPKAGSLSASASGPALLRVDNYRPLDRCDWELKVGETPAAEGYWILEPGTHRARWDFSLCAPEFALDDETPPAVRGALRRCGHTAMTFRPDIGSLSNSGASMLCPISMDTWAAQAVRMGDYLPGRHCTGLVRQSLERWLDGGPGYASGRLKAEGKIYSAEDEYLMTATSALMGLAEFLHHQPPDGWIEEHRIRIAAKIGETQARDLDGDGLIESPYRTGVSGSGHWSTCWFDVLTCGWKDAFSNAILHEALLLFQQAFRGTALEEQVPALEEWARRLRENYLPTFFSEDNGWFAAWRCREDRLHDYAFLPANGAAVAAGLVPPALGAKILGGLLQEMDHVGLPSAEYGLPGNLHPIPDEDLCEIMRGYPFGYYQNGGRTHAQTRHFLRGLYAAGLNREADALLETLCRGLVERDVFGGVNSGLDWRYWDDRPCGYEGLLTDQFGFLAVALERYGT